MASANSSLDGNSNSDTLTRSFSVSNNERNRSAHANQEQDNSPRDYDGLKQQCDMAMHELHALRRQQNETIRRCELTMKELEYYRGQHHAAMTQLEATTQESSSLRTKYTELVTDKQRLDREVSELRCNQQISQQDVIVPETNNGDSINQHYITALKKYDAMKEEYDALRKRYDDLIASHSSAVDKLELTQEELGRLKTQCEEMVKERNVAVRERNGLKQQCTAAIRQWDNALRELNECQEALGKVQQQHEEAMKEINQAMAVRIKASKDLKRLTEERNAAMQEYSLIMSERDTVHKEMEKLSEDLTQAFKKNKALEMESKESMEEKKALSYHIETLKREIASALHDRDKALKECNDLREKFGEFTAKEDSQREAFKARFDSAYIRGERDAGRKDPRELQTASMDLFGQKERMDNLDQANQEIERLRKHADKLQAELQESIQEAEVSKRRRDWAFSERDKIVLERESIRTLCDRLRKERDRAVSELAEALRDSDDIKKQRNEKTKELKVLKEKMEAQMEKETRMLQYAASHSYSHDSAIDTDMQEWETEMLNIDLSGLGSNEDLGLELVGGRDDPHYPNDSGIYVSSVLKNSIAEGKLKPNDCIVRVNNLDCSSVSKRMVLETMRANGGTAVIVIRRRRVGARCLFTTQLQVNNYDHGLSLETGIYISKISPGSLAAKESNIAVGDRVLSINNKTMDGLKNCREALSILNEPTDVLTITTLKSSGSGCVLGCKMCNASTQTERESLSRLSAADQAPLFPPRVAKWPVAAARRSTNDESATKLNNRNSSPVTFEQERDDAIAELDSVIESHHPRPQRRTKLLEKNGGTWPKTRSGPVIEHATGTILHPRKNKERLPLSFLLNNPPPGYSLPPCCSEQSRRSVLAPSDASIDLSVKSGNIGKEVLEYYVKKKTHKYHHSGDGDSGAADSHSRIHSQLYGSPHYPFAPFHHPHPHSHPRYPSPSPTPTPTPGHIPSSRSGDSISLSDSRSYSFEPPYSPVSQVHHTHSPSVDSSHYHKDRSGTSSHLHQSYRPNNDELPTHDSYHTFEGGTFPRKKENQRFRIPSNPSVASKSSGGKVSTGSIEKSSERGSPMPTFHVEVLSPGLRQNKRNSLPDYCWSQKPLPGELRRVHIDKSVEPLGIQISCLESGGVFVSTVSEHSLASQVGLQVGDQLLEVCGINMRSATYQLAANVLRQCGNSITMLVQYSPEKYHELEGTASSSSGGSITRSGSPTPCNSPRTNRKSSPLELTHSQIAQAISTLSRQKPSERVSEEPKSLMYDPRYLLIETRKCSNLGISLVGGNAVGIYVHSVQANSLAYNAGLRTGDRILEYNGTDLRQATAEEAAYELAKPADKVTVLAQYNMDRYNEIKDKPGDSFYIRALFDRPTGEGGSNDALQLRFRKDDVLYVDNTMFNGVPGNWRAWLLDEDGCRQQCGIIPSKYKVEEELLLRRSLGDLEADARRATRRSFFRRKKHQRSDSKELASFSNITLGWYSDSGPLNEETTLASYQRVTRLSCLANGCFSRCLKMSYSNSKRRVTSSTDPVFRPVLIVGPLADCVTDKLIQDFPDKFARCMPEVMHCSQATMEKGIADSLFVDYRKKGSFFECTSVSAVKDMCDKNGHCVIDVGLASVERLHRHQVYPIVLLIKFKSTKQIKEVKDTRYSLDKVTAKIAKEMYEHAAKLESEYRHYISAVIPAGVNLAYMCTQIKAAVDLEQSKTLWVPCTNA